MRPVTPYSPAVSVWDAVGVTVAVAGVGVSVGGEVEDVWKLEVLVGERGEVVPLGSGVMLWEVPVTSCGVPGIVVPGVAKGV